MASGEDASACIRPVRLDGFRLLGRAYPYWWPSRSSFFGIVDLAGFPKDVYYMYKSEWTDEPVLHIFPHWNWKEGEPVDIWAYYNNADEVELYLNGKSLGVRQKRTVPIMSLGVCLLRPEP